MTLHHNYIGCDIAKQMLDVFDPARGKLARIENAAGAIRAFAAGLGGDCFVVFEATGHHDRLLRHALAEAGIPFARINPTMVRRFAEARGKHAKTDSLDARMLSRFGAMFQPAPDPAPCAEHERLVALARRRDQLVDIRAGQYKHLGEAFDAQVIADIAALIAHLDARITALEAEIRCRIEADGNLAEQAGRLVSAPGVGPVTALTLMAHMPELGQLSPKSAASLAGLAPFNNDSGSRCGRRSIRAGRPRLRKALYMAALGAIRKSARFKAFYNAIAAHSASKKVAIIAVARKLLTILNAMQRDKKTYA